MNTLHLYKPLDESRLEIRVLEIISPCSLALENPISSRLRPRQKQRRQKQRRQKQQRKSYARNQSTLLSPVVTQPSAEYRLHVISLLDNPSFAALSYVWGDQNITNEIQVNKTPVPVTTNLATALKFVKGHWQAEFPNSNASSFRLWVDAICINQSDLDERSSQVSLMGRIFRSAKIVFSWLGNDIDGIGLAIKTFNIIAKEIAHEARKFLPKKFVGSPCRDMGLTWMKRYPQLCRIDNEDFGNTAWDSLVTFFDNPYWSRVWIFQEMVLASRLLFVHGSTSLPLEYLESASLYLIGIRGIEAKPVYQHFMDPEIFSELTRGMLLPTRPMAPIGKARDAMLSRAPNEIKALTGNDAFHALIGVSMTRECSDPRDYIYGVIGLTDYRIIPDYSKDFPSVLTDLVCVILEENKNLQFLAYSGTGIFGSETENVPSWAPNLQVYSKHSEGGVTISTGNASCGIFRTTDKPFLIDSALFATAVIGSTVSQVHPPFINCTSDTWMEDIAGFVFDLVARNPLYVSGIHPVNAFFQAMKAGKLNEQEFLSQACILLAILSLNPDCNSRLKLPQDHDFDKALINIFYNGRDTSTIELPQINSTRVEGSNLMAELELGQNSHRLIETDDGYLGLAPKGTLPGDKIVILKDCPVPMVLRKVANYYLNIGSCFIAGLMEGEAAAWVANERATVEQISIR